MYPFRLQQCNMMYPSSRIIEITIKVSLEALDELTKKLH
uniref:Uncharacterized protein n=1 Tax=Arundo donax TaxID=35708 RepID=A0A0A9HP95_ARUDO